MVPPREGIDVPFTGVDRKGSPDAIWFHFGLIWELLFTYFDEVLEISGCAFSAQLHYEISVRCN